MVFGLHLAAGCPERIIRARINFMAKARRRFKLRGYFSDQWGFSNGCFQGDPFSVDDVCLVTSVWQRRMARRVPGCLASSFS